MSAVEDKAERTIAVQSPSCTTLNELDRVEGETVHSTGIEKVRDIADAVDISEHDTFIVDWDGPDDPENPKK